MIRSEGRNGMESAMSRAEGCSDGACTEPEIRGGMEIPDAAALREDILSKVGQYYEVVHARKPFQRGTSRVPYSGRVFDASEMRNLVDSALEFWLTSGPWTEKFEKGLASFLGVRHCSLVNSGSSANLVAITALTNAKLGKRRLVAGDEIITVAAGFPTTVAPIIQNRLVPVFVDVDIPTYNIKVEDLDRALSPRTKAIMVAHTLGNPFDLGAVRDFCDRNNLWLVEDNCDALGSMYRGKKTGTFGDISTFSFYPPHQMTMGEGGAVATNSTKLKLVIESVRDWGRDCWCPSGKDNTCKKRFDWQLGQLPAGYDHKYIYSSLGYNLKATDMQAAVGCAQLEKLPSFVEARRRNWGALRQAMLPFEDRLILPEATKDSDPCWFGFMVTIREKAGFTRSEAVKFLESRHIQTRMLFAGNIIRHPAFDDFRGNDAYYRTVGNLANTDRIMTDSFWIGVYPGLDGDMVAYMADTLGEFLKGRR